MTRRLTGRGFVVLACLLGFGSACSPADPPAPPPPASTSATPTETAQEREQRLAYEAAEKSYRDFRTEYNRLTTAGGASKPTSTISATSGGSYQEELMDVLKAFKKTGSRTRGTETIPVVHRSGYSPEALLLEACEDDRGVQTLNRKGKIIDSGDVLTVRLEVRRVGTAWKVWSGSGSGVKTCDGF